MTSIRRFGWLAMAMASCVIPVTAAETASKPNVIVILADDLGYGELGFQGNKEIPTPHIDSIAANGTRFTNGYVSGPYCSPTRAGLMTGRYQTRFGHEWNPGGVRATAGLPIQETTMAQRLKALGYATCAIGKWHLGEADQFKPTKRGFDEFYGTLANTPYFHPKLFVDSRVSNDVQEILDDKFYTTDAYAVRAVDWIDKHKTEPFFLYLPFNAQHGPLEAPQKYLDRFPNIQDTKRKTFAAIMSAMDDAVGQVLGAVRQQGLEERTLIVFLTDNGGPTPGTTSKNDPLRGVKMTTLEGGIRVPFCLQWKGRLPAGKTYDHPVIQLDILPTAVAAAGGTVDANWKLDGVNLLPYLEGKNTGKPHESLFWRMGPQWAVRHGDFKLVANRIDGETPRLFNLSQDIGEATDLMARQPEKAAELKAIYDKWNAEQAKPLWGSTDGAPAKNKKKAKKNQ